MSEKLEQIIQWMSDFKIKNNVNGVVLGLSGGKDSTTVAMLAKKVFGDNVLDLKLDEITSSNADVMLDSTLVDEYTTIIIEADLHTDFSYVEDLGYEITKQKKYKTNQHVFLERA